MPETNKAQRMAEIKEEINRLKEEQSNFSPETDRWEVIKTEIEQLEAELQNLNTLS